MARAKKVTSEVDIESPGPSMAVTYALQVPPPVRVGHVFVIHHGMVKDVPGYIFGTYTTNDPKQIAELDKNPASFGRLED